MTRAALLLRGVNVGTKNSLPMAELRAMLAKVGPLVSALVWEPGERRIEPR